MWICAEDVLESQRLSVCLFFSGKSCPTSLSTGVRQEQCWKPAAFLSGPLHRKSCQSSFLWASGRKKEEANPLRKKFCSFS